MDNRIIYGIIGVIIGAFMMHWLFFPEVKTETVIETKIEIDTVFVTILDTVTLTKTNIKHTVIRDTVLLEPIKPEIKEFKAFFPVLYGNAYLKGEVFGEVLKTSLTTDFKIPTVTNIITETKTVTNTITPRGLYLGASINSELVPSVGVSYLDKSWLFNYDYQPSTKFHSVGIARKLF